MKIGEGERLQTAWLVGSAIGIILKFKNHSRVFIFIVHKACVGINSQNKGTIVSSPSILLALNLNLNIWDYGTVLAIAAAETVLNKRHVERKSSIYATLPNSVVCVEF